MTWSSLCCGASLPSWLSGFCGSCVPLSSPRVSHVDTDRRNLVTMSGQRSWSRSRTCRKRQTPIPVPLRGAVRPAREAVTPSVGAFAVRLPETAAPPIGEFPVPLVRMAHARTINACTYEKKHRAMRRYTAYEENMENVGLGWSSTLVELRRLGIGVICRKVHHRHALVTAPSTVPTKKARLVTVPGSWHTPPKRHASTQTARDLRLCQRSWVNQGDTPCACKRLYSMKPGNRSALKTLRCSHPSVAKSRCACMRAGCAIATCTS